MAKISIAGRVDSAELFSDLLVKEFGSAKKAIDAIFNSDLRYAEMVFDTFRDEIRCKDDLIEIEEEVIKELDERSHNEK